MLCFDNICRKAVAGLRDSGTARHLHAADLHSVRHDAHGAVREHGQEVEVQRRARAWVAVIRVALLPRGAVALDIGRDGARARTLRQLVDQG